MRRLLAPLLLLLPLLATPAHAAVPPPTGRSDLRSFTGLGTWVDGYDFARELTRSPSVTARTVGFMAQRGVKTIYLQGAKQSAKTPNAMLSRDRVGQILLAAHARGIRVVGWYLPTFDSPAADWAHLDAMMQFKVNGQHFDAIGLDIEDKDVPVATRNARLVDLTRRARARTWLPIAAIVLPPVLTEIVHPGYWGGPFPWAALKPAYDVWIPMGYYTAYTKWPRWRNAATSTTEDIRRIREHLQARVPVAYAGGLAGSSSATDYQRFTSAARGEGALGVSAYDYATTPGWAWSHLQAGATAR
ncbi:MAG: N-acetylmuramoyl-L-alanine amidase [Frankiales bacterium]|nr:N-acetylmuramoyl-L-alanine amidase [Frankiales bacterium]